jgi:hypothetical protein
VAIVELVCESSRTPIQSQITIATIEPQSGVSRGVPSMFSLVPCISARSPAQLRPADSPQTDAMDISSQEYLLAGPIGCSTSERSTLGI